MLIFKQIYHFFHFGFGIRSQSRDNSVPQHNQRNYRNQISKYYPTDAKRFYKRCRKQYANRRKQHRHNTENSSVLNFKNPDRLIVLYGIFEYHLSLFWFEMMKRKKHGSETV